MKNSLWVFMGLAGLTWACSSPVAPVEEDLTQYVNPFIGTDFYRKHLSGCTSAFWHGSTSPDNGLPGWDRSQAITIRTVPLPDLAIRIFQEQEQVICTIFLLCQ
mgnify:CR=1 FL=1